MIVDCFPFFNEADTLEIRLNELAPVVDKFVIVEAEETFGGQPRALKFDPERFKAFNIDYRPVAKLYPECKDRVTGREREADLRNRMLPILREFAQPNNVVIISDCDEIPRRQAVIDALPRLSSGIHRFAQRSFYYTVNWLVDVGHDFASRARIGTMAQLEAVGSVYGFRMAPAEVIENGGWHFGYFADIKEKVAALAPFLAEYRLFGEAQLEADILAGRDIHHRKCELPERFTYCESDDPTLPRHYLENMGKFKHFTLEGRA